MKISTLGSMDRPNGTAWAVARTEFGLRGFLFAKAVATLNRAEYNIYCRFSGMFDRCSKLLGGKEAVSMGPVYIGHNHQYWHLRPEQGPEFQLVFCGRLDGPRENYISGMDLKVGPLSFRNGAKEYANGKLFLSPYQEAMGITELKSPFDQQQRPKEQSFADLKFSRSFEVSGQQACVQLFTESFYQQLQSVTVDPKPKNTVIKHLVDRSVALVSWDKPPAMQKCKVECVYRFFRTEWKFPPQIQTSSKQLAIRPLIGPYPKTNWDSKTSAEDIRKGFLSRSAGRASGKLHGIDPTSASVQRVKNQLKPSDFLQKAGGDQRIAEALAIATFTEKIPYEMPNREMFQKYGGWPPLEVYIDEKRGCECGGHGMVFCSIARAMGIPARRSLIPHVVAKGKNDFRFASHMSAEFYHEKHGWIPIDCTGPPTQWGYYPLRSISRTPVLPGFVNIFSEKPENDQTTQNGTKLDMYHNDTVITHFV